MQRDMKAWATCIIPEAATLTSTEVLRPQVLEDCACAKRDSRQVFPSRTSLRIRRLRLGDPDLSRGLRRRASGPDLFRGFFVSGFSV